MNVNHVTLNDMKYLAIIIVCLFLMGVGCMYHNSSDTYLRNIDRQISQGEEPEEWFACNTDADCVYIDNDVCQFQGQGLGWRVANKNFVTEFQAVNNSERQGVMCTEMYIYPPEDSAICVSGMCQNPAL